MSGAFAAWLAADPTALVDELVRRLCGRAGSLYRALGEAAVRPHAARLIDGLRRDLAAASGSGVREALSALLEDPAARGVTFADLKLLATTTRQATAAALQGVALADEQRARLDEWMFQLALLVGQRLLAEREREYHEQAAQAEVRQLEHQLSELTAAYAEKTRLLDLIRSASTPIAPIHDGILVVPLVGLFDGERAQSMTERLLARVGEARARVVILDVSGVPVFDAEAAHHIFRTAAAVRLLGARLIVVGLSPGVAQTVVELGVDLTGLTTLSTLQAGLDHALALRRRRIVAV